MTRREIFDDFRVENPELTDRAVTDVELGVWAFRADKIICAVTRCIVADAVITSVASTSAYDTKYDLTSEISKFYDIDDYPGGGVAFDDSPLKKTTVAELDLLSPSWRTRAAGEPQKYYRRGKYLYFDRPVKEADLEIRVYVVLISDDFNNDNITPFNQLTYLEPFHNGINKYLQWQAKLKVGKPADAQKAEQDFYGFTTLMKKQITGGRVANIYYQPKE